MREIYKIFNLEGKTAIVTGASKGLGYGIAECFAKAGINLVLANRNPQEGAKAKEKLDSYGTKVIFIPTDVSQKDSVDNMVGKTINEFGRIDILINNAGIINRNPLLDLQEKEWNQVIDTNLKGYFLCAQAAAKQMMKHDGGKIVNIASIRSLLVADKRSAYCATKGGVVQLTKSMAVEWAPHRILVNAVAPGYFATEMVTNYFAKMPEMERTVLDGVPLGRIGQPGDLGGVAIFLASNASDYITGEVIYIDGGWCVWKF